MTRKRSLAVLVMICLFGALLALPATCTAKEAKYTWKVATLAPKGVGWAKQVAEILVPAMDRATGGDLALKIYWGGIMGDDEDYIKKMRIDQLQAGGITAQGAVLIDKSWYVTELPFLFNNYDEVDFIKRKMFDDFNRIMREQGFTLVVWIDQDFDQIYSVKRPLRRPQDFRGLRIVTWYGELEEHVLTMLGATPISVNVPEIPAALRSGIADANIAPAIWTVGTQMYSLERYVNTMNIRYAPALIIVNNKSWDEMPAKYLNALKEQRWEITDRFAADTRRDNAKCLKAMLDYGMQEARITPKNLEKFKEILHPVRQEMVGKLYSQELLDNLLANLEEYRRTHQKK